MNKSDYAQYLDTVDETLTMATQRGLTKQVVEDEQLNGRTIRLQGRDLLNFASCSYLGLELAPRVIAGAVEAAQRYGTQFATSRAYLSTGQYVELEARLTEIFGTPLIVSLSTMMGHLDTLPTVIEEGDAIILDQFVHASVHTTAELLKARGIYTTVILHNRLDLLQRKIEGLKAKHRRIWYLIDGVYSMHGDLAPIPELLRLLDAYEELYVYADDAHGTSWLGQHGCGYVLDHGRLHDKMIVTASLNKAFGTAGGVVLFPNPEWRRRVHHGGRALTFSGPISPPMLGAALASARLHLSAEIDERQAQLGERIRYCNQLLQQHALPVVAETHSPIFFVGVGSPVAGYNLVERLVQAGHYTNLATFPAVSLRHTGVRFTITLHHRRADIEQLVAALAHAYPLALQEAGFTRPEVARAFKL